MSENGQAFLIAKFLWCEFIRPFGEIFLILLLLPILFPFVLIGLGCANVSEKWREFKLTERIRSERETVGGDHA